MTINEKREKQLETLERVSLYEYLENLITQDGRIEDLSNKAKKETKLYYALNRTIFVKYKIDA